MTSTSWHETIDEDEQAQFEAAIGLVNSLQAAMANSQTQPTRRAFHVKSHAGVRGAFAVLGSIPDEAKHGLFAEPRVYDASVRFSNGFSTAKHDLFPDTRGIAVRVLGVDGARLLPEDMPEPVQDLIALNVPHIPFRNIVDFAVISTSATRNPLRAGGDVIRQMGLIGGLRVLIWGLRLAPPPPSLASETYFGLLPVTLGPHAVKYKWVPHQRRGRWPRISLRRDSFRDDLASRLTKGDLRFDLMVQFFVDEKRTPIENGAYPWPERDSPFVKIGELSVPPQDVTTEEAREFEEELQRTAFNPWNGIEAHRPLGNTQRGRRFVYQASVARRRQVDTH